MSEKVYEFSKEDFEKIDVKSEAEILKTKIDEAKKERDIQSYIKDKQKWFIPVSILKAYDFGHHLACVVPEFRLGSEYKMDYLLIGKNSLAWQFVFVEFEDVNVDCKKATSNEFTESVRKGLTQIDDWKRWIENHLRYFIESKVVQKYCNSVPRWAIHYCLVVGRRDRMDDTARCMRGEKEKEAGVKIVTYDRLVDYVRELNYGI